VAFIIDYQHVLSRTREMGLRCAYYNSGAFTYPTDRAQDVRIVGWIGPEDPTIRADLPATLVRVRPPYEANLTRKLIEIWKSEIDGPAWVLPKSHWSFELDHGSDAWLPGVIESIGVDPGMLEKRTNAAAIEFSQKQSDSLETTLTALLTHLRSSDFAVLFPHHSHMVTVHHHKQLWWQTEDEALAVKLARPEWNDAADNAE
jgi:hypothetical protein